MIRRTALSQVFEIAPSDWSDHDLLERYLGHGEQAAFAALLHRHGPLVLGLSRRLVRDAHLAEDVFQATFLVLARKAHRIRKRDAVASWLHGVATRLARQACLSESAHALRQRRGARKEGSASDPAGDELVRVLHEELARLPERFRAPLLLCYLEGRTQDEAAFQLGWSLSTLRRRLEQGRERLRERMTRRGATLGAGLLAAALSPAGNAAVVVPEPLRQAVHALLEADAAGAPLPAAVAVLANHGLPIMTLSKLLIALTMATLLGGALLATALHPRRPVASAPHGALVQAPDAPEPEALPRGAVVRLGTLAFRHGRLDYFHTPSSLRFTPDGKHLVSAGGGWLRRWDALNGEAIVTVGEGGKDFTQPRPYSLFTEDGRVGLIGDSGPDGIGGSARRWTEYDLRSGKEGRRFGQVTAVGVVVNETLANHLSPDGNVLASLPGAFGSVTLWNTKDGTLRHHLKADKAPFTGLAFHPDGKSVLLGDADYRLHLYDLTTGVPRSCGDAEKDHCVGRMAISPDGRWVATAGGKQGRKASISQHDAYLRLWDLKTGKVVHTLAVAEDSGPQTLVFTPDSATLIAGLQGYEKGEPAAVRTWDVATGKAGRAWEGDATIGLILAVSPDGKRLGTMNDQGVIRLWDMLSGKEIRPLQASPCALDAVCFVGEGNRLLTAGSDLSVREWDATNGKLLRVTPANGKGTRPEFVAEGAMLSVSHWNAGRSVGLRVYDSATGKLLLQRSGRLPAFTRDGKLLAALEKDGRVPVIAVATGKVVHTLSPPTDAALQYPQHLPVGFSADGQRLVLLGPTLAVYSVTTGAALSSWNLVENNVLPGRRTKEEKTRLSWDRIEGWAISPDGKTVALGMLKDRPGRRDGFPDPAGRVYLLDTAGKVLRQIDVEELRTGTLAFSPDGKRLALGGMWEVRVWDVASGKQLHQFAGHRGRITSVAFSKDGTRLASASEDSSVLVWDVAAR